MNVSVVICTWNRSKLLDQTLFAMRKLRIPSDVQWELLIVNNNCTDETDTILDKHSADLPIRPLFEQRPGKSFAANTAIAAAKHDLILWTDDDALVDSDWLAQYVKASEEW